MATTSDSGFFTLGNSSAATQLHGFPSGGTLGQVIAKLDATDYNFAWTTLLPTSVAASGTTASSQVNLQPNGVMATAGLYRVSIFIEVTTIGTAGTIQPQVLFTDDAIAETISGTAFTVTATGMTQMSAVIYSTGVLNIVAKATASGITGGCVYTMKSAIERLA